MRVDTRTREDDGYIRDIVNAVLGVLREHGAPVDGGCVRALVNALSHTLDQSRVAQIRGGTALRETVLVDAVWETLQARRLVITDATRRALANAVWTSLNSRKQ